MFAVSVSYSNKLAFIFKDFTHAFLTFGIYGEFFSSNKFLCYD